MTRRLSTQTKDAGTCTGCELKTFILKLSQLSGRRKWFHLELVYDPIKLQKMTIFHSQQRRLIGSAFLLQRFEMDCVNSQRL